MNGFLDLGRSFVGDPWWVPAINLILQATLLMALTLALVRTVLRHRPATRHGVLQCVFAYLLFSPILAWVMARTNWPLLALTPAPEVMRPATFVPAPPLPPAPSALSAPTAPVPRVELIGPATPVQAVPPTAEAPVSPAPAVEGPDMLQPLETGRDMAGTVAPPTETLADDPAAISQSDGNTSGAIDSGLLRMLTDALIAIWGIGVVAALLRFAFGRVQVARLRRDATEVDDQTLEGILMEVRGALDARQLPPIVTVCGISGPIVVGVRRPIVMLPEGLMAHLGRTQLRDVLVHECAHVVLRHPLEGMLQRIVSLLFWPHPLVHLLGRELAQAREEVCDNFVLDQTAATDYARTLLKMAEGASGRRPAASLTLLPLRFRLEQRIAGLLNPRRDRGTQMPRWQFGATLAFCLLMTALVGVGGVPAQRAPQPPPVPTAPAPGVTPAAGPEAPAPVAPPAPGATPAPSVPVAPPAPTAAPSPGARPEAPTPPSGLNNVQPVPTAVPPTAGSALPTAPVPGQPPSSVDPARATPSPAPAGVQTTPPSPEAPSKPSAPAANPPAPTTTPTSPVITASAFVGAPTPDGPVVAPAAPATSQVDAASAAAADRAEAQRVTLKLSKTTLGEALQELMEMAHANYTLDNRISDEPIGAIRLEGVRFRAALETILAAPVHPATYTLENFIYRISPKDPSELKPDRPAENANPAGAGSSRAPQQKRVYVFGNVKRPGYYACVQGDRILDALKHCGGPLPGSDLLHLRLVHHQGASQATTQTVNLDRFLRGGHVEANSVLSPGDVIYVPLKKTASAPGGMRGAPMPPNDRISVDFTNADLYTALRLMFEKAGAQYTLDPRVKPLPITARIMNTPFREALDQVLQNSGQSITYRLADGVYNIVPKDESSAEPSPQSDEGSVAPPQPVIELNLDHGNLTSALKSLAGQAHLTIIEDPSLGNPVITLHVKQPLSLAVQTLSRAVGATYAFNNNTLTLHSAKTAADTSSGRP
jgi:beta-lactamase regulating signal transducer with metallopeptidase domain